MTLLLRVGTEGGDTALRKVLGSNLLGLEAQVVQKRVEAQALVADVYKDVAAAIKGAEGKRHPILQLYLRGGGWLDISCENKTGGNIWFNVGHCAGRERIAATY